MHSGQMAALLGDCKVVTTSHRGSTPEELAELALDKIIHIGGRSDPVITAQAIAFKDRLRSVLVHYLTRAQEAERDTICAKLSQQGQSDMAAHIRSM